MLYFYFFIYLTIKQRKSIFYTVFVVELFAIFYKQKTIFTTILYAFLPFFAPRNASPSLAP